MPWRQVEPITWAEQGERRLLWLSCPVSVGCRDSVLTADGMLPLPVGSMRPSCIPFFLYLTQHTGKNLHGPRQCATLHF